MSQGRIPIFEAILRMCAEATPDAWHPRAYAERSGTDPEVLYNAVEWLYLEGLVEKAAGDRDRGPGITLTPLGRRVVDDRAALERLRNGEPIDQTSVGGVVRRSLMGGTIPVINRLLLFANIAVFAWGAYLASKVPGLIGAYLTGFPRQQDVEAYVGILHRIGSVEAADLNVGQWWRLLTCMFVHGGALHLGMNMYALYAVGGFAEQTWGRWRYLTIYLLGGWGGSCLALALTPGPLVGASGALCGILGAEGVWVLLYGRHLPAQFASRVRSQMITNLILVAVMSALPRVSWQAHLGGAIGGAAAALILHFQRFGPAPMRVIGVLALVPLAWGGYAYMQRGRNKPAQQKAAKEQEEVKRKADGERDEAKQKVTRDEYHQLLHKPMEGVIDVYLEKLVPLIEQHPERWDAAELKAALAAAAATRKRMTALLGTVEGQPAQADPRLKDLRQASIAYVRQGITLFDESSRYLGKRQEWLKEGGRKAWQKAEDDLKGHHNDFEDARKRWRRAVGR